MADYLSIDEAKARSWEKEVREEIEQVKGILNDAIKAQLELPGEKDSIMQGIHSFYTKVDSTWNDTCKSFVRAGELLDQALTELFKTTQRLTDEADAMASKLGFGGGNGGGGFR